MHVVSGEVRPEKIPLVVIEDLPDVADFAYVVGEKVAAERPSEACKAQCHQKQCLKDGVSNYVSKSLFRGDFLVSNFRVSNDQTLGIRTLRLRVIGFLLSTGS